MQEIDVKNRHSRGILTCLPHPYVKRWLGWYLDSGSSVPLYLIKADNWTDEDLVLCTEVVNKVGGKILFWDDIWDAGIERHKRRGKHCAYGLKQDWWQRFLATDAPELWAWLDSDLRVNRCVEDMFSAFDRLPNNAWAMMPSYYHAGANAISFAKKHGDIEFWNCCCIFRKCDTMRKIVDDMVSIGHERWLPDEDAFTFAIKKSPELKKGVYSLNHGNQLLFLDGLEPAFDASAENRASADFVHYGGLPRQLIFQGYKGDDICPNVEELLHPKKFPSAVIAYVRSIFLKGWLAAYEQSGSKTPLVLFQNIDWTSEDIKLAQDTVSKTGGIVVRRSYEPLLRTCDMYIEGNYSDRKFGRAKARNFALKNYLYQHALRKYVEDALWLDDDVEVIGNIDSIFTKCRTIHDQYPEKVIFSNRNKWPKRRAGQFGAVLLLKESLVVINKLIAEAEARNIIHDDEMGLKELMNRDADVRDCLGFWSDYKTTQRFCQDSSWVSYDELVKTKNNYTVVHWYVIPKDRVAQILAQRALEKSSVRNTPLRVYVSSGISV